MLSETRDSVARLAVGLALLLLLLGSVVTFVPGGEAWWFRMAAGAAAVGLLSPGWRVRAVAIVLVVVLVWQAHLGEERGREYREHLREKRLPFPGGSDQ